MMASLFICKNKTKINFSQSCTSTIICCNDLSHVCSLKTCSYTVSILWRFSLETMTIALRAKSVIWLNNVLIYCESMSGWSLFCVVLGIWITMYPHICNMSLTKSKYLCSASLCMQYIACTSFSTTFTTDNDSSCSFVSFDHAWTCVRFCGKIWDFWLVCSNLQLYQWNLSNSGQVR